MSVTDTAAPELGEQRALIDRLLKERTQMLVLYCRVAGLEPFRPDKPSLDLLQSFCQILIDYSALWHFEIYQALSQGRAEDDAALQAAVHAYPAIVDAAEAAVNFNDRYDASSHELNTAALDKDLSEVGQMLAARIEAEDKVLAVLLGD